MKISRELIAVSNYYYDYNSLVSFNGYSYYYQDYNYCTLLGSKLWEMIYTQTRVQTLCRFYALSCPNVPLEYLIIVFQCAVECTTI